MIMLILFPNKRFQTKIKKEKRSKKSVRLANHSWLSVKNNQSAIIVLQITTGISISSEGIVGNAKGH